MQTSTQIWVLDFGSQYTHLIVTSFRKLGYSSDLIYLSQWELWVKERTLPKMLVLSGSPNSVSTLESQDEQKLRDVLQFCEDKNLGLLGICYGMQLLAHLGGGRVKKGVQGEYGLGIVPELGQVWMSHGDEVVQLPENFQSLFVSNHGVQAGMRHASRPWWGVQFHPEVKHSEKGLQFLQNCIDEVNTLERDWRSEGLLRRLRNDLSRYSGKKILCAFSGGIDSLVAAILLSEVVGENSLYCFFVDHGFLRPQDLEHIENLKKETSLNIEVVDARELFAQRLQGVVEPEEKRKRAGHAFIEVFENTKKNYEKNHGWNFEYLLQGTLYPDIVESQSGSKHTIKSHHNVGGLPEKMSLRLIEPLRDLYKDEVRALGLELGLRPKWIGRHPFPGPGQLIRVMGEATTLRLERLAKADQILFQELNNFGLYEKIWQAFMVYLPIKTVGVKGDERAYEEVMALRLVESSDAMTAEISEVSFAFLRKISSRITNEVTGITRVVYDITSKPPGTIEWE